MTHRAKVVVRIYSHLCLCVCVCVCLCVFLFSESEPFPQVSISLSVQIKPFNSAQPNLILSSLVAVYKLGVAKGHLFGLAKMDGDTVFWPCPCKFGGVRKTHSTRIPSGSH